MRLLVVTHYFPAHHGGIESVALRLAEALAAAPGTEVEWMASDCDPAPEALPPRLRCLPAASWNGIERAAGLPAPLWSPAAIAGLRAAIARCDVVHLHDCLYLGNVCAFFLARRAGKPVVITQHVGHIAYPSAAARATLAALNRTLAGRMLSGAERAFFVSPAVQRYFEGFCEFRTPPACVPNGVDGALYALADAARMAELRRAAGRDPARPLCLFVGRFVARKGVALLLTLARSLPEVDWLMAGDGPLRPEDSGLPNLSVLRGRPAPELVPLYRMADLLVLPSTGEGFPLVVQEAFACGTPVLTSAETAAGSPQAAHLLHTEASWQPERWREHVARLLADREALHAERPSLGAAARALWSWEAVVETYRAALGAAACA